LATAAGEERVGHTAPDLGAGGNEAAHARGPGGGIEVRPACAERPLASLAILTQARGLAAELPGLLALGRPYVDAATLAGKRHPREGQGPTTFTLEIPPFAGLLDFLPARFGSRKARLRLLPRCRGPALSQRTDATGDCTTDGQSGYGVSKSETEAHRMSSGGLLCAGTRGA
jgi:hypothetical protein